MHLREMTVKIPPPEEQRAIAHILGTLDDKIELNRRMSETLEAIARTLFKSWFVAFDPVHEKVGGSQTRRSSSDVLRLFPDSFEQSGGRQIPSGWTCAPLSHWVKAISGGTPAKDDSTLWGGDIPWISPKAMDWVHADETDHYVVEAAIGNGTQTAPPGATLVMVRGMGLHEKVRVSQTRGRVAFNQDVKALVGSGIEPVLLFFALLDAQQNLLERVESAGHGTGKLPTEILLSHPITMPTVAIQRQLARVLDALNDRMASARSQSRTLATLRDALLPRLVSGELRVNQGEQIVATEARV
jgi:type I restriction enzyme S subunit